MIFTKITYQSYEQIDPTFSNISNDKTGFNLKYPNINMVNERSNNCEPNIYLMENRKKYWNLDTFYINYLQFGLIGWKHHTDKEIK